MPIFQRGDHVIINSVSSNNYGKEGIVESYNAECCCVSIPGERTIYVHPKYLTYTTDEKIKRLPNKDRALVLKIIPGKWVAYDDRGTYFSAFETNSSPVFNTKTDAIAELSSIHLDKRKHKTVKRKSHGYYWYEFRDSNTKEWKCFAVQKVTKENVNIMREYCIQALKQTDNK